ncbi:hypothetical protein [Streptomyces prasinus]|uniref:hypothetical protein n=1 Tax=Streptomyces prasinus TaxID=67345 RepID=UPI0033EC49F7
MQGKLIKHFTLGQHVSEPVGADAPEPWKPVGSAGGRTARSGQEMRHAKAQGCGKRVMR